MSRSTRSFDKLMQTWPMGKVVNRFGNWPVLGPLLRPSFDAEGNKAIIIPIHEALRGSESAILPFQLLTPIIQQASAWTTLGECLCRRGERCQTHPQEIGCLFLDDGANDTNPAMGQQASVGKSLAHVQRAMESGLVPLVVHSSFDSWMKGCGRCEAVDPVHAIVLQIADDLNFQGQLCERIGQRTDIGIASADQARLPISEGHRGRP